MATYLNGEPIQCECGGDIRKVMKEITEYKYSNEFQWWTDCTSPETLEVSYYCEECNKQYNLEGVKAQ